MSEPERNPRTNGLGLLLASRLLRGLAAGMVTLGVPYLVLKELHASTIVLGGVFAAGALATAAFTFLFGRLGSRVALRPAFLLALGLLPVAAGLLLLPWSLPTMFVASILGGFSATGSLAGGGVGGAAFPLQTTILSDLVPSENRTRWFSLFTFLTSLSATAGLLLGGGASLEELFLLAFLLSLGSVVVAFFVPVRPVTRGRRPAVSSRRVIRRFTATGVLNGFSQGLLTPFLIPFFVLVFDTPRPEMSTWAALSGGIGSFSILLAPQLDRRFGFVRAIVGTRLTAASLAVVMPFLPFVGALAVYLVLPALRVAALPAQTAALMGRLPHEDRSEGAGTNEAARIGSASGATLLSGFAIEDVTLAVPFVGYAAALLVNSVLYVHFFGWDGERIPTVPDAAAA